MTRLILICALFLTACARPDPAVHLVTAEVAQHLRQPVHVVCAPGYSSSAAGECLMALRAGLNECNGRILSIDETLILSENRKMTRR